MTALGYTTTNETVVGYRCWRVMPFTRLDGTSTYRLCAVGTGGIPKVWEPRQATRAVCSAYDTHHEAPWPDHECGVWALKDATRARRRMVTFMQTQGGDPVGWAFGPVSLWGRLIEHEQGWRAQHAYPYAIAVESPDEEIARVLRLEYAVDVEWNGPELSEAVRRKVAERQRRAAEEAERATEAARERQRAFDEQMAKSMRRLEKIKEDLRRSRTGSKEHDILDEEDGPPLHPVPDLSDLTVDEVLCAMVMELAHVAWRWPRERPLLPDSHGSREVTPKVLYRRGVEGPIEARGSGLRPGVEEAVSRVKAVMIEARDAGLLEYDVLHENRRSRFHSWFPTRQALDRVADIGTPSPDWEWVKGGSKRVDVDVADCARRLRELPRRMFVHEVEAALPGWIGERQAAERLGRLAYREWLAERRRTTLEPAALWVEDDELLRGLRHLKKPVTASRLLDRVTPGRPRFQSETARAFSQLTRMGKAGLVDREETDDGIRWRLCHSTIAA